MIVSPFHKAKKKGWSGFIGQAKRLASLFGRVSQCLETITLEGARVEIKLVKCPYVANTLEVSIVIMCGYIMIVEVVDDVWNYQAGQSPSVILAGLRSSISVSINQFMNGDSHDLYGAVRSGTSKYREGMQ